MSERYNEGEEIRFQVVQFEGGLPVSFVQDLVVALMDVYVRLGRIWPEMATRWHAEGKYGGSDWRYTNSLGETYNTIFEIAEYFGHGLNLIPGLQEKFGQKQDTDHCPVCQHFRKRNPEFKDCWYCREDFGETEELKSYRESCRESFRESPWPRDAQRIIDLIWCNIQQASDGG